MGRIGREKRKTTEKGQDRKKPPELPKTLQLETPQILLEKKPEKVKIKVRQNALEIRKAVWEEENKMLAQVLQPSQIEEKLKE